MTTNDCIKEVHAALVAKAQAKAAIAGNNKLALEISGKIAEYGAQWATAFGNDGKLDDDEERALNAKFNTIVDTYLPSKSGTLVDKAWNGVTICFVKVFNGVKYYLNQWFNLGLASVACAAIFGSVLFSGCASSPRGIKVVASSASMTTVGDINWDEYKIPVFSVISGPRSTVWVNKDYLALSMVRAGGCVTNNTSALAIYTDQSSRNNFIELHFQPTNACPCVTNSCCCTASPTNSCCCTPIASPTNTTSRATTSL